MRIVFFGTNDFSATVLSGLIEAGKEIVGVVSQPDKVNGRNNKITISPVKRLAESRGIPLFQFSKLNIEGEQPLRDLNPDLFITASYGQIIKQNILDIPKHGTVNVHASLLPKYRGPAPIQWAIMNGETETGITIMQTALGVDTGDIYFQRSMSIDHGDTSSSVFRKLSTLGAECINEFIDNFETYQNRHFPQDEEKATYYPMIKKEDYLLDFANTSDSIYNKVRALENCYFLYNGVRYKVLEVSHISQSGIAGEILSANGKNGLIIATKDSAVEIVTIQPEGKQKMPARAYMNSNKFKQGDIIESIK